MSERPPLPSPSEPPPTKEPPPTRERSLAAGIGLAWLVMVGGELLILMSGRLGIIFGGMLVPPLLILVWGIVSLARGDRRLGKGLLLGLASILAVALLLVAACFGLMSNLNFH